MQVKLRAIAPQGDTTSTALDACAELLSRAIRDEGRLHIDLYLLPERGGDRLCRKLREHRFSLGGRADHLSLHLSTDADGVSVTSPPGEDWAVVVCCGVDIRSVIESDREQREDLLADLTCAGLEALRPDATALIRRVRADLALARGARSSHPAAASRSEKPQAGSAGPIGRVRYGCSLIDDGASRLHVVAPSASPEPRPSPASSRAPHPVARASPWRAPTRAPSASAW